MRPSRIIARPCRHILGLSLVLAFLLSSPAVAGSEAISALSADGVSNFHQIDDHVFRGAQPTAEAFKSLAKLGIRTVLDLRWTGERSREEERIVTAAGMRYVSMPFRGLGAPTEEEMSEALALLEDPSAGPVFVHCRRGADRTGTVIACYRIQHDHWANQTALIEAKLCGMSWVERAMQQYILRYRASESLASTPRSSPDSGKTNPVLATAVH